MPVPWLGLITPLSRSIGSIVGMDGERRPLSQLATASKVELLITTDFEF